MAAVPGPLGGEYQRVSFGPVSVQFVSVSRDGVSRGANLTGQFGYLVQLDGRRPCVWNGYTMSDGGVVTYGANAEHAGFAPAGAEVAIVSLPLTLLSPLLGVVPTAVSERFARGCNRVKLGLVDHGLLCWRLLELRAVVSRTPELLQVAAVRETFGQWLVECLRWLVDRGTDTGEASGTAGRRHEWMRLLRNAEEHLTREVRDQEIRLRPFCRALGVTRGRLRRACRELLRMEPLNYLERYRRETLALPGVDPG